MLTGYGTAIRKEGFAKIWARTCQTSGNIFELRIASIFAPFMAVFIVLRKVPLLFAKQKLRVPKRSKIIDREVQKLRKPP